MRQLQPLWRIAQGLVVPNLLEHDNVRRLLAQILRHQPHALGVPLEPRGSGDKPGRRHRVPRIVGNYAQSTRLGENRGGKVRNEVVASDGRCGW